MVAHAANAVCSTHAPASHPVLDDDPLEEAPPADVVEEADEPVLELASDDVESPTLEVDAPVVAAAPPVPVVLEKSCEHAAVSEPKSATNAQERPSIAVGAARRIAGFG